MSERCGVCIYCILADPFHVATQGVLDNSLGIATLGWIICGERPVEEAQPNVPPDNIGLSEGEPRREWWVRENQNEPLVGPFSFRDASKHARYLSQCEDRSGLAQVCTFVGTRGGDPKTEPELRVAYMYIKGKMTLGGRMAEYHSDRDLPPT